MKKTILYAIAGCMIIVCSSGCSNMAPACADKSTVDLVVKVVNDHLFDKGLITYSHKVSDIRTTKVDKDTGAYSCAAYLSQDMTIKEADGERAKEALRLRVMWDGGLRYDNGENHFLTVKKITYTSELTSDNKHYVSVSGWSKYW
ncbi:MAG: hypothetical protein CVU54_03930 [Deltaproteobacteria bacterium HGW-Deltaproteobacteria-12]|jgi:hypothetical protein|nr:MAG: hypothetical protein CVU54_03930 [Deltaproteobacteria bacterium HGW-Deltaproteobacteria-12]